MFDKIRLPLLLFFLFSFRLHAQELNTTHYDLSDHLPSSTVYTLHQDSHGVIWMGTGIGICRYDGYEFTFFGQQDGIPGFSVLKLFPQKNGDIWGTCYNQTIFYFNADFDGFHAFPHNDSLNFHFAANAEIKSITVDKAGTIHIGGYAIPPSFQIDAIGNVDYDEDHNLHANYLCLIKDHFFVSTSLNATVEESTYIRVENLSPSVHIGGIRINDSLAVFMGSNVVVIKSEDGIKQIKSDHIPIVLRKMNDSSFAVGYYQGGVKFFDESGKLTAHFMKGQSISDILVDHNGGYWFSNLYQGLQYVENLKIKSVIRDESITDIAKDRHGNIFVGCSNGKVFKRANYHFENFYTPIKSVNPARFTYDVKNDSLHIYSHHHLIDQNGNEVKKVGHKGKLPEYLLEISDSSSYFDWPFRFSDTAVQLLTRRARDVAQHEKNTYISTDYQLLKYDRDTLISISEYNKLLSYRIEDINIPYGRNIAFLGTVGSGLIVVSGKKLIKIDSKQGLSSDYLNKVYVENDSTIWVGTNKGLNVITMDRNYQYTIQSIGRQQGLIGNRITDILAMNDTIWVGTKIGLCYFPKNILVEKPDPQLFFRLKNVFLNGDTLHNNAKLTHNQNTISFHLNAISFDRNESIIYHYRIKELNENWRTTKNREIVFQDLNPGSYTFEARVELEGYFPDDLVQFNFTIHPPFWNTWWFYSLYVLVGGFIIYLFFKIRVLTYNKDVVRELMRHLLKRIKKEEHSFVVRASGEDIKILSETVLYVKSAGNYLELYTTKEKHIIRGKISTFIDQTTDPLEYLRVHRSYVIRIDKVDKKGKNWVVINGEKIPVGESYLDKLKGIQF